MGRASPGFIAVKLCTAASQRGFIETATVKLLWEVAMHGLNKHHMVASLSGFVGHVAISWHYVAIKCFGRWVALESCTKADL